MADLFGPGFDSLQLHKNTSEVRREISRLPVGRQVSLLTFHD